MRVDFMPILKLRTLVITAPMVLRAALRLHRLPSDLNLPQLIDSLRHVRPTRVPITDPSMVPWSVERFLRLVPPHDLGHCLKRSLLLLDVLARLGMQPKFHLGFVGDPSLRRLHAWVTTPGNDTDESFEQVWSY